jgi:hypothetical protein
MGIGPPANRELHEFSGPWPVGSVPPPSLDGRWGAAVGRLCVRTESAAVEAGIVELGAYRLELDDGD